MTDLNGLGKAVVRGRGGWNPGQAQKGCAHILWKRKVWLVSLLCQSCKSHGHSLSCPHSPASGPLLRREVLCVVCAANEDDFVLWAFWWGEARGAELLK